jgi:diguanylate cyclase (GGDEF)-like protein
LLQDRLAHAIAIKYRDGKKMALLFIDLDGFKEVNDNFGHDAGDALLKNVAAKLLDVMRSEDTVSRLGGDEFIILVEDVRDLENLKIVAQKAISSIRESFSFRGQEMVIGASMGISIFPSDGLDIESLIKKADLAMYDAKKNGKNNFRFYIEDAYNDVAKSIQG